MSICNTILISENEKIKAAEYVIEKALTPRRVVVAMSGGVDSSVVAWLLKEAGHEVIGVSLRLAPDDDGSLKVRHGRCCSADDMTDARQVCDKLGVPFYAIDARDRFKETVFDPFIKSYRAGITPIPCLACNHEVKFGDLYKTAKALNADLATGHYAKVVDYKGVRAIARPHDLSRDQTYYLYGTKPEVVASLMMPLGELEKPFVRALAAKFSLPVFAKPDSQEICFVPDGDHAKVVERASGPMPSGDLVHISGKKLTQHPGIHNFTIGQRRGINIGTGEKLYVADIDASTNKVTVGPKESLLCHEIKASPLRAAVPLELWPDRVRVQVRARHDAQPATLICKDNEISIKFDDAVSAVALGQAAVFYDGDVMLGGALITGRLDGAMPRTVPTL